MKPCLSSRPFRDFNLKAIMKTRPLKRPVPSPKQPLRGLNLWLLWRIQVFLAPEAPLLGVQMRPVLQTSLGQLEEPKMSCLARRKPPERPDFKLF